MQMGCTQPTSSTLIWTSINSNPSHPHNRTVRLILHSSKPINKVHPLVDLARSWERANKVFGRDYPHISFHMTPTLYPTGYVRTHIILPSTIYGIASGALVDLEVQNPYSQQIPKLIQTSLDRGQGGMVGRGKNVWPNVHIGEGNVLNALTLYRRCQQL